MNGRSKSILLQVAFKGAIEIGDPTPATITGLYETLLSLHDTLGIDSDDGPKRGGGSGWSGGSKTTALPEGTSIFVARGTQIVDYRAAKTAGNVNAKFPDFKTLDNSKIFDGNDGVWLNDQQGNPNESILDLVAAAEQGAIF